jgi:uncharacterized BrkB/YihY/UPF0761 family membrane protein
VREITLPRARAESLAIAHELVAALVGHRLTTHATALAFRVFTSLVPLAVLGIGLLRAIGLQSVWTDSISPTLHDHLAPSAAAAADDAARAIFARDGVPLLVVVPARSFARSFGG